MKNQSINPLFKKEEAMQTGQHESNIEKMFKIKIAISKAGSNPQAKKINDISLLLKKSPKQIEILLNVLFKKMESKFPTAEIVVSARLVGEVNTSNTFSYISSKGYIKQA